MLDSLSHRFLDFTTCLHLTARLTLATGLVLPVAFTACVPHYGGAVSADGYRNQALELEVSALPDGSLMGADWRLDNLYGKPLKPKKGSEYETTYYFDGDGDGQYERKEVVHAYELRFEHVKHAGVAWVRMVPISETDAEREPRVLARDYLAAIAGVGVETASLYGDQGRIQKRFAAEIIDEATGTLAGASAHSITIDVANVDQVQVVKSDRVRRVHVVFARPDVMYEVVSERKSRSYPILFVAGYSNLPEDYDGSLPDFQSLLERISIKGTSGVALQKTNEAESDAEEKADSEEPTSEPEPAGAAEPGDDAAAPADSEKDSDDDTESRPGEE